MSWTSGAYKIQIACRCKWTPILRRCRQLWKCQRYSRGRFRGCSLRGGENESGENREGEDGKGWGGQGVIGHYPLFAHISTGLYILQHDRCHLRMYQHHSTIHIQRDVEQTFSDISFYSH